MHVFVDRGQGWERLKLAEARQASEGRFLDSVASTKVEWSPVRELQGSWLKPATSN
jgi:hypothetical protein